MQAKSTEALSNDKAFRKSAGRKLRKILEKNAVTTVLKINPIIPDFLRPIVKKIIFRLFHQLTVLSLKVMDC